MDLVSSLSSELGIEMGKAQGLAGAVLAALEQELGQKLGAAGAASLAAQIPELASWKEKAAELGAGSFRAPNAGFDLTSLVQLAARAGVGAAAAEKLLPLLAEFLEAKLDPALLKQVQRAVPALKGTQGGGWLESLGAMLGGWL